MTKLTLNLLRVVNFSVELLNFNRLRSRWCYRYFSREVIRTEKLRDICVCYNVEEFINIETVLIVVLVIVVGLYARCRRKREMSRIDHHMSWLCKCMNSLGRIYERRCETDLYTTHACI